jgi:hypothetical protein
MNEKRKDSGERKQCGKRSGREITRKEIEIKTME